MQFPFQLRHATSGSRRCFVPFAAMAILAAILSACGAKPPAGPSVSPTPSGGTVAIMGHARLTAPQIVVWFNLRLPRPAGEYGATVPLETLAAYFLEEGSAEGVAGDVAFVQSIVETGWFRFGGAVPAWKNNFAGIGAIDSNPGAAASFPDARTGVRAQIQHLRAYADPTAYACTVPPLHYGCVDPRFDLVEPKGKSPTWNQMGNGNWASASTYATSILTLYAEAFEFDAAR